MSSLHREVMLVLLGDITGGAVAEGEKLPPLTELATQFGVSTGVIRECQRALAIFAALHQVNLRHPSTNRWARTAIARASDRLATGGLAVVAAAAGVLALIATASLVLSDTSGAACFAREHTAFVVVAGGIASSAVALPVALANVARRG